MTSINLSDLIIAIQTDLGIIARVTIKRVPPCEMRYNDGRCEVEKRGYRVLISEYLVTPEKLIRTLAHELRHVWQYETGFAMTLTDTFSAPDVYAAAPEEIDAKAYAATVAARYVGDTVCTWK